MPSPQQHMWDAMGAASRAGCTQGLCFPSQCTIAVLELSCPNVHCIEGSGQQEWGFTAIPAVLERSAVSKVSLCFV